MTITCSSTVLAMWLACNIYNMQQLLVACAALGPLAWDHSAHDGLLLQVSKLAWQHFE